ncbi:MAG: outer membrane lipoprotein chaperone LolA, partial [Halieaceae bacterium]|nr:outer membrane lipoprotein chaperone LolA [Halieaceae bacterium]
MVRISILAAVLLLSLFSPLRANDGAQRLEAALKKMDSLSSEFSQTLLDEDKNVIQQSRGTLALQRPGKFAWFYTEPFEQRIVGDGTELWVYDV